MMQVVLQSTAQQNAGVMMSMLVAVGITIWMGYRAVTGNLWLSREQVKRNHQGKLAQIRRQGELQQARIDAGLDVEPDRTSELAREVDKLRVKLDEIEREVGHLPENIRKELAQSLNELSPEIAREVEAYLEPSMATASGDSFEVGGDLDTETERDPYGGRTTRPDPDSMFSDTETRTGSDSSVTPPDLESLPDPEDLPDPETVRKR